MHCPQAAAERQLREQGQLAAAADGGDKAAATEPAAGPSTAAAAGADGPDREDAGAAEAEGGKPAPKKSKVLTAKEKEEAQIKAKRKEIMDRAGGGIRPEVTEE